MSDLTALIARVDAATGPDREIDGAIVLALGGPPETALPFQSDVAWKYRGAGEWVTPSPRSVGLAIVWKCPPYTASIDAALALVEAKLPGWTWGVWQPPHGLPSRAGVGFRDEKKFHAHAPTPALALISALLRAMQGGA